MGKPKPPKELKAFQPGVVIDDRYEVESVLGYGATGFVVKVRDQSLTGETVALKLLFPRFVKDKETFTRFRNEVLIARKLSHPNIIQLYDFGDAGNGYYYISMEYVPGADLDKRIEASPERILPFPKSVRVLHQLAQALEHAHSKEVVHRDIKPGNIIVDDNFDIKITDFGVARSLVNKEGLTQTGEAIGSPHYMAPEQLNAKTVDARADLYCFGIVAYELVTGRPPFHSDHWIALAAMHLNDPLPPLPEQVPDWYQEMVYTLTEKEPEDRYQSAAELLAILEPNLAELDPTARLVSRPTEAFIPKRPSRLYPALAALTGFIIVLGAIGLTRYIPGFIQSLF